MDEIQAKVAPVHDEEQVLSKDEALVGLAFIFTETPKECIGDALVFAIVEGLGSDTRQQFQYGQAVQKFLHCIFFLKNISNSYIWNCCQLSSFMCVNFNS